MEHDHICSHEVPDMRSALLFCHTSLPQAGSTSLRLLRPQLCAQVPKRQSSLSSWRSQTPLLLTYARLFAVPLLCGLHLAPSYPFQGLLCSGVFAFAAFTDFLDGYLARRWGVETSFGAFLDPVADKLMVAAALVLVCRRISVHSSVLSAIVILCREIFVSALREWMALRNDSAAVKVGFLGKVKTATQMLALTVLLAFSSATSALAKVALALLAFSALLAVVSAAGYVRAALPTLKRQD